MAVLYPHLSTIVLNEDPRHSVKAAEMRNRSEAGNYRDCREVVGVGLKKIGFKSIFAAFSFEKTTTMTTT